MLDNHSFAALSCGVNNFFKKIIGEKNSTFLFAQNELLFKNQQGQDGKSNRNFD